MDRQETEREQAEDQTEDVRPRLTRVENVGQEVRSQGNGGEVATLLVFAEM